MGGLFGGAPKSPAPPTPAPTLSNPAVLDQQRQQAVAAAQAAGRASTILTSPLGDTSSTPVQKAALLGSG